MRFTFNTSEAAEVVTLLKPRVVVPVHYEGWSHFRENRDVFEPALAATGADVRWLTPGEATVDRLTPTPAARPMCGSAGRASRRCPMRITRRIVGPSSSP